MKTEGFPAVFIDETSLVSQAVDSPAAFTELYNRYYPRVFKYVRYRCEDQATTEDLTALVFERLLTRIGTYRPERGPFSAWLFAIARNIVNGHLRNLRRRIWISIDTLMHWPSHESGLEDTVIQKETEANFLEAINRLSGRERDILGLKFAARLTNRQIAGITGLSESNVGVILYRTLSRLRNEITSKEPKLVSNVNYVERSDERA